ncbi:MAG: cytochrome P450 [Deltaproteobacteria bacterium]
MSHAVSSAPFPQGPKGLPLVGCLIPFLRDPLGFLLECVRRGDDIINFRLGYKNIFLLNHPDYIQEVMTNHYANFTKGVAWERGKIVLGEGLLTSEGEFHRRQRRLAQPAFHRQRIASYAAVMSDCSARLRDEWRDGGIADISQEMYRLTLTIVSKTLFGADVESDTQEISHALTVFRQNWWRTFIMPHLPFYKTLEKLPIPAIAHSNEAKRRLDAVVYRIIRSRRGGRDTGDLLSMLLAASDADGDNSSMTDTQARDEVMTIFLAGHETTASSLSWAWHLIAEHPEVERKLHAEIDSVLGGRLPEFDDAARLRYTKAVFAEALRLYPPVWLTPRLAQRDYRLGSYTIPAGSILLICPYSIHRHPGYFADPLAFNPERWSAQPADTPSTRFAYIPFGGGPRHCIGEQFAWTEAILVLAAVAQRWRMKSEPGYSVEPEPYVTLRPKRVMMRLEKRDVPR